MSLVLDRSEILPRILRAFAKSLTVDRIEPGEDYFEQGGDSLSALRLVRELRTSIDARIRMADLIRNPTAEGLADAIVERLGEHSRG